ncbi:MAG: hypothetical protein M3069_03030 [Chloroflexota bacterium]|nr:hypothetical protein [Chloroflexota bacterium]
MLHVTATTNPMGLLRVMSHYLGNLPFPGLGPPKEIRNGYLFRFGLTQGCACLQVDLDAMVDVLLKDNSLSRTLVPDLVISSVNSHVNATPLGPLIGEDLRLLRQTWLRQHLIEMTGIEGSPCGRQNCPISVKRRQYKLRLSGIYLI